MSKNKVLGLDDLKRVAINFKEKRLNKEYYYTKREVGGKLILTGPYPNKNFLKDSDTIVILPTCSPYKAMEMVRKNEG